MGISSFKNSRSIFRFGIQSGVSVAVSIGLPWMLVDFIGLVPQMAVLAGIVTAFFVNFAMCRWYVFRASAKPLGRQFKAFAASSLGFRLAEYTVFLVALAMLDLPYLPVFASVVVMSFFAKFVFYSAAVFT